MKTDNDTTGAGDESGPPSGKKLTAAQVAQGLNANSNGAGWMACCPAHDDKNPSLSIKEGSGGKLLLKCFAGCSWEKIISALEERGIQTAAGGAGARGSTQPSDKRARRKRKIHDTLDNAAAAALWIVEKKTGEKYTETRRDLYPSPEGTPFAVEFRFDNGGNDKTFITAHAVDGGWQIGDPEDKWFPFNAHKIKPDSNPVYIVEGPKSVCAGESIGLNCTTSAYGSMSPKKTGWEPLKDHDAIILPDNDDAGIQYAHTVASLVQKVGAKSVKVVNLPDLPAKGDLYDFVESRTGRPADLIREEIEAAVVKAPLWEPPCIARVKSEYSVDPVEAAKQGKPYPMTDLGNAERLVRLFGETIRWDIALEKWRIWDGRRWAIDRSYGVMRLATKTVRNIRKEADCAKTSVDGNDKRMALVKFSIKSESRDGLKAMVELAKSQPGIPVLPEAWDVDEYAFNCKNGTIDLRTGVLRAHDPKDMITKLSSVEYDPTVKDERWEKFLYDATNGSHEVIDFLQSSAGYSLTGDTSEEYLFLIYGLEASGKSTFLDAMRKIMGDYSRLIQPEMLLRQKNTDGAGRATPELATLAGARFAAGSEMDEGRDFAEALTKNLTGGESITARHLYAPLFEYRPQFKLWLAVNHCPRVSADDGAMWRRIIRIGFNNTLSVADRDKTLKRYLRNPKTGAKAVLAWAVEGCKKWQRDGLPIPEEVLASTNAYRKESDPLSVFFEDYLEFKPNAFTFWKQLWDAYNECADMEGVSQRYRVAPKRIQDKLRDKGCKPVRRHFGRGWEGVGIKPDLSEVSQTYTQRSQIDEFQMTTSMSEALERIRQCSTPVNSN